MKTEGKEMLEIMKKIIGMPGEMITMETSFQEDLELDSFDLVQIIAEVEEIYDVEIPSEDVEQMDTVGDVIEYLKEKGVEEK